MRLYAIGDIHGQLDALTAAHERILQDGGKQALIVHVGDLLDRGPDSRGVVDYLMAGQLAGRPWVVLKGNHDRFLPRYVDTPEWTDPNMRFGAHWILHQGLGAAATLRSYGVDPQLTESTLHRETCKAVPETHLAFLKSLPNSYLHPLGLCVHAGVRPGVDLRDQSEDDLVWIRDGFLDSTANHGPLIVHGHTALEQAAHYGNRLNIDSGAGYGRALSAVVIEPGEVNLLTDQGREPVRPTQSASAAPQSAP